MPWSCVRGARGRSGESGLAPVLASPPGLLPSLASLAVRVAGCPVRFSLLFACRYAIPCGLCVPGARSGSLWGPCRVSVACARTRAPATYAPPRIGVARALRAVLVEGAGRALPGGSCFSAFPAPVPCSAYFALGGGWPGLWVFLHGVRSLAPEREGLISQARFGGGAPLAWVLGVRGWALSNTRLPVLRACGQGPLPTGCGCGGCGRGDPLPNPQRALPSWLCALRGRHEATMGPGASCLGVGRPGLGALPRPTARHWGVLPGRTTHRLWMRGVWAWVPVAKPTARAGFVRCGAARGRQGGALLSWVWGVWGRALSLARPPVLGAGGRGLLPTCCGCGGCGRASLLCTLWGQHEGARGGGGVSCLGVGLSGLGALPCQTAHPWNVRLGPATHWPWMRGVGAWRPITNPTVRAVASWLCAL